MNKFTWIGCLWACLYSGLSTAATLPAADRMNELNAQVLRVEVNHRDGRHGLGSAVVIAQDQVVTNCHVVTDATEVQIVQNDKRYVASAVKPDWYHDLCILTVTGLDAPIAKMGKSQHLKYETPVLTVGYPDGVTRPVNTNGVVKGLYPMDNGMIIRATSAFKLGASGGGMFDATGLLVGIITLKSRGADAHYYFMPVEWVVALMEKPAQALGQNAQAPFWASAMPNRPYFMQVVQPAVAHDWRKLLAVSRAWASNEPGTAESWVYLGLAEYETRDYENAEVHFKQALALRSDCAMVSDYLRKISEKVTTPAEFNQMALLVH